jgi:hypothetical protein
MASGIRVLTDVVPNWKNPSVSIIHCSVEISRIPLNGSGDRRRQ